MKIYSCLYLNLFIKKFQKNNTYYWPSTKENAKVIFLDYFYAANLQELLFEMVLEQGLDFLSTNDKELLQDFQGHNQTFDPLKIIEKSRLKEIFSCFKKNSLSSWSYDFILFSYIVYCILEEMDNTTKCSNQIQLSNTNFNLSLWNDGTRVLFCLRITQFLMTHTLKLQLYYFLKKHNVLLQYKTITIRITLTEILNKRFSLDETSLEEFVENFSLIWDLLNFSENEYAEVTKKIKVSSDISQISTIFLCYLSQ